MEKYKNRYRIKSARHPNWNYGHAGFYFITICTHNRVHFFGKSQNQTILLSKIGEIVEYEWIKTFKMRPDMHLWMGEYVVMPNHFHAIIGIGPNRYNTPYIYKNAMHGNNRDAMHCNNRDAMHGNNRDAMHCVSRYNTSSQNRFGPQSKNLASIIRGFKTGVTKNARRINPNFKWQPRYYDHIIQNEKSFKRITQYIINNPLKWEKDRFQNE